MLNTREDVVAFKRKKRASKPQKNRKPTELSTLTLRLLLAADNHAPTVAGALDVSVSCVIDRVTCRPIRAQSDRARAAIQKENMRAGWLRRWWRCRFQRIGVEPALIPLDDPMWPACHAFARGHLVRLAARQLRRELGGALPLDTYERVTRLLDRVAALQAKTPAELGELGAL